MHVSRGIFIAILCMVTVTLCVIVAFVVNKASDSTNTLYMSILGTMLLALCSGIAVYYVLDKRDYWLQDKVNEYRY